MGDSERKVKDPKFLTKWTEVAAAIYRLDPEDRYGTVLQRETLATYSHIGAILYAFEKLGFIEREVIGSKKLIEMTDKGESFFETADAFVTEVNENVETIEEMA